MEDLEIRFRVYKQTIGMDKFMAVNLGDRVKDTVTGLVGIASARVEYLNKCVRIKVNPPVDKEGKRQAAIYIDEPQLRVDALAQVEIKKPVDDKRIDLGDEVKSQLTGFKGIAFYRQITISGEIYYGVQPPCKKDGSMLDDAIIPAAHLINLEPGKCKVSIQVTSTGGPMGPEINSNKL